MVLGIPITQNISIASGDDQTFEATIGSSDGVADFDYSGYDVFFTVKNNKTEYDSDTLAVYQLVTSDITLSASGTPLVTSVNFDFYARETAASDGTPLEPNTYYYDIQFVAPGGKPVQTWWRGKFKVTWHSTVAVA